MRKALNAKPDKVTKAGLFPPSELLAAFARETKISSSMPITAVVDAFVAACQIDAALRWKGHVELKKVATQLDVPLPLEDMVTFCAAPCNSSDRLAVAMLTEYARARSRGERAGPNVRLPKHKPRTLRDLHDMCGKHNVLDCYLWLAHRFPETFPESDAAMAQKRRCIGLVAAGLASRGCSCPRRRRPTRSSSPRRKRSRLRGGCGACCEEIRRNKVLYYKHGTKMAVSGRGCDSRSAEHRRRMYKKQLRARPSGGCADLPITCKQPRWMTADLDRGDKPRNGRERGQGNFAGVSAREYRRVFY